MSVSAPVQDQWLCSCRLINPARTFERRLEEEQIEHGGAVDHVHEEHAFPVVVRLAWELRHELSMLLHPLHFFQLEQRRLG